MTKAAMIAESRAHSGIRPVDRPLAVMLLRSGSQFDVACSACHQTIARNLPDAGDLHSRAELFARHRMDCPGPRRKWMRRMIRLFALS